MTTQAHNAISKKQAMEIIKRKTPAKTITSPLLETAIKKTILIGVFVHGAISLLLIILSISDNSDLNFISWSALTFPPFFIIMEHLRNRRLIALPYGGEKRWETISFDEDKLHKQSITTILPSIGSWYRNLSITKKLMWVLIFYVFIMCIYGVSLSYFVALMVYFFMFSRYFLSFLKLQKKSYFISIIDDILVIPVFGFFKFYSLKTSLREIKKIEAIGSQENINMTLNSEVEEIINSRSIFMQGVVIYYGNKPSVTLSTAIIDFDFLYKLISMLDIAQEEKIKIRFI